MATYSKKFMRNVATQNGINDVIFVKANDIHYTEMGASYFIDNVYLTNNTIFVGIFKNRQYMLAFFFRELGRAKLINERGFDTTISDKDVWDCGLALAKNYEINFSKRTKLWIDKIIHLEKNGG